MIIDRGNIKVLTSYHEGQVLIEFPFSRTLDITNLEMDKFRDFFGIKFASSGAILTDFNDKKLVISFYSGLEEDVISDLKNKIIEFSEETLEKLEIIKRKEQAEGQVKRNVEGQRKEDILEKFERAVYRM